MKIFTKALTLNSDLQVRFGMMRKLAVFIACISFVFCLLGCPEPSVTEPQLPETPVASELATPLTIEVASDTQIYVKNPWSTLKYKKNGGEAVRIIATENDFNSRGMMAVIDVVSGDKLEFFADGSENMTAEYPLNIYCRYGTECYVYGNVMSLLSSTNFETLTEITEEKAFYQLFCDTRIKNHNEKDILLPATSLSKDCYNGMFTMCMDITKTSALPATTLAEGCYESMFGWCTNLTRAPELPATTLAKNCYKGMFQGCPQLNYVKCLATNISAEDCTTDWLADVSDTGTFVKANGVDWSRDENGIPDGWTIE